MLPKIIPDFAEQCPSVDQRIVEYSGADILPSLEAGAVDLILTNLQPKQGGVHRAAPDG